MGTRLLYRTAYAFAFSSLAFTFIFAQKSASPLIAACTPTYPGGFAFYYNLNFATASALALIASWLLAQHLEPQRRGAHNRRAFSAYIMPPFYLMCQKSKGYFLLGLLGIPAGLVLWLVLAINFGAIFARDTARIASSMLC